MIGGITLSTTLTGKVDVTLDPYSIFESLASLVQKAPSFGECQREEAMTTLQYIYYGEPVSFRALDNLSRCFENLGWLNLNKDDYGVAVGLRDHFHLEMLKVQQELGKL